MWRITEMVTFNRSPWFYVVFFGLFASFLSACNSKSSQPNVDLIQDMMVSPSLEEQDVDPTDPNDRAMKVPPVGTVPQGFKPYRYKGRPLDAEKNLKNPYEGNFSPEILAMGKAKFEIYCMVCHGEQGHGDGTVAPKMALKPPSLISDKIRGFKDGRIFHIVTDGQGVMGSYASQIPHEEDRWKIVNYVRQLQKTQSSTGP